MKIVTILKIETIYIIKPTYNLRVAVSMINTITKFGSYTSKTLLALSFEGATC